MSKWVYMALGILFLVLLTGVFAFITVFIPAWLLHLALTGFGLAVTFDAVLALWSLVVIIYMLFIKK